MLDAQQVRREVEAVYRRDSRRILATLIRLLGDFDLAEEALHDAFFIAVERWQRDGIPDNPRAWLVSAGRFKAIDALRRRARFDRSQADLVMLLEDQRHGPGEEEDLVDDRLRLIFTCCHPALSADAQVPLTLREVCDLTTEQIARAFLQSPATIAQRIVRAKAKIRDARIPYQVPALAELPERLESVLRVVYLVFNEGYSASTGDDLIQRELCDEAIRLGRLLAQLLPDAEVLGLLALMLLQASRLQARSDAAGSWWCWTDRTAASGIVPRSPKVANWCSRHCAAGSSEPIACRRPLPRYMPKPQVPSRPTGRKSLGCTMYCNGTGRHRWSSLTGRRHWPGGTGQGRGLWRSRRFCSVASCVTIIWPMLPGRSCTVSWGRTSRLAQPGSRRWRLPGRGRRGGTSSGVCGSWIARRRG